jgi:hypothetical protein
MRIASLDAGAAGDRAEEVADAAVGAEGVASAQPRVGEALGVGAVLAGVGGDEPALELVADHQVAGRAEQDERRRDREREPDAEAERGAAAHPRAHAAARPVGPRGRRGVGRHGHAPV